MFTLLATWISQRIITVTAVSVLTVAAVPTTLVLVSHDDHKTTTVSIIQPADAQAKTVMISAVKKAGDDLIAKLDTAESSCATQMTHTVSASKVSAKLQPALATSKSQLHSSVAPVVAAIKSDEVRFAHLTYVSQQDEDNELADLHLIEILALGNGQTAGTVTVTCQTVTITITQTIQITVIQETPPPAVCKAHDEED
jgi:Tfp pilus tip-associated adhesin PilY1